MWTEWRIREDGGFDAVLGEITLRGAYPAIDGVPVRATAVAVTHDAVTYRLPRGELVLRFEKDADGLVLRSELRGVERAPWFVHPIAGATPEGAARVFRQGVGFAGPSGWSGLDELRKDGKAVESYLATGFADDEGATIAIGAIKHDRFLQRSRIDMRQDRRGLINRHLEREAIAFEAGFSTENVPVDGILRLPDLHLIADNDALETFRRLATRIAEAHELPARKPPSYHWCSWYTRGPHFTRGDLDGLLAGLDALKPRLPLQAIQIDDGYCTWQGDWLEPNGRWPGGMQGAFEAIAKHGYLPGVWVAPFMVSNRSRLFREHPDWIIREPGGKPHVEMRNNDASQPDEERYALDASRPEVVDYIEHVFRTMRGWGARFFKTDFMDWGLKDSSRVVRHNPRETSVESFRKVLRAIRGAIGDDSTWLACIAPFGPFIGFADAMRTANDTHTRWHAGSTGNMLDETWAGQWMNGTLWQNDPDVTYVRAWPSELSEAETRALAYWAGVTGGSVNTSDMLHEVPAERLALWRFLRPDAKHVAAALLRWSQPDELRVAVRPYAEHGGWAVVALNPTPRRVVRMLTVAELFGREDARVSLWNERGVQPLGPRNELVADLEPHAAQLWYLSVRDDRPPAGLTLGGAVA